MMSDDNTRDGAEPSPASAGSHGDATPLFSERLRMSDAAVEWSNKRKVCAGPFNIVTALFSLGLVTKRPVLTYEEREAIAGAIDWINEELDEDCLVMLCPQKQAAWTAALRSLLERMR